MEDQQSQDNYPDYFSSLYLERYPIVRCPESICKHHYLSGSDSTAANGNPSILCIAPGILSRVNRWSFYNSIGVHAAACLWMAAGRSFVLKFLEPKSGYSIDQNQMVTLLAFLVFQYVSILMLIYFSFISAWKFLPLFIWEKFSLKLSWAL